jgi:hypothetical protein
MLFCSQIRVSAPTSHVGLLVYGVFWYGKHRRGAVTKHPGRKPAPKTALELEAMLNEIIAAEQRNKLCAVVIDVSVPDGQRVGGPKARSASN